MRSQGGCYSLVCGTASVVHGETTMTCGFSVTEQPLVIEDAWFTRGKHRGVRATLSILHGQIMTNMRAVFLGTIVPTGC